MRTALAALVFALLYGAAIRLYIYLRAGRDAHRWHLRAVAAAALVGGLAFYAAQQIRLPHRPDWRDLVAFLIMAVAAAAIPAIVETTRVLQARVLRETSLRVPEKVQPPPPPSGDAKPTSGSL